MSGWRQAPSHAELLNGEEFSPPVLGERTALSTAMLPESPRLLEHAIIEEKVNHSAGCSFLPETANGSETDSLQRITKMQVQLLSMMHGLYKAVEDGNRRIEERLDIFDKPTTHRAHTLSHLNSVSNSSLGAPSQFGGNRGRWAPLSHTYSGSVHGSQSSSMTLRRPPPPPPLETRDRFMPHAHAILPNQELPS
eukprot:379005-Amphidinium_carterae.2